MKKLILILSISFLFFYNLSYSNDFKLPDITPKDLVNEPEILKFFMEDINALLDNYSPGNPDLKVDVKKQLAELKIQRENKMKEMMQKQSEQQSLISKLTTINNQDTLNKQLNEQSVVIQQLTVENTKLKEQVSYLNNKITQLIKEQLEKRKDEKNKNP